MLDKGLIDIILQGGAIACLLFVGSLLQRGHLRTRQEVETWERVVLAERSRAERAEAQVDALVPTIDRLATAINHQTDVFDAFGLEQRRLGKGEAR